MTDAGLDLTTHIDAIADIFDQTLDLARGLSEEQGELWTEVNVTEGTVVVRTAGRETRLAAGARWSSETQRVASAAPLGDTADSPSPRSGTADGAEPATPATEPHELHHDRPAL